MWGLDDEEGWRTTASISFPSTCFSSLFPVIAQAVAFSTDNKHTGAAGVAELSSAWKGKTYAERAFPCNGIWRKIQSRG